MTTDPTGGQLRTLTDTLRAQHPEVFATYGDGADMDSAFDDAAAAAGNDHGYTGIHPSLASAESDAIRVMDGPALPAAAATLRAGADLAAGDLTAGVVYAYPVAVASGFTRRRARLVLVDTDLAAPRVLGRLGHLDDDLRGAVEAALEAVGAPLGADEVLESVEVVRKSSRFKPVVEVFRTASSSTHALLDPATNTLVATGFAKASEARREAVERAKAGPLSSSASDAELGELHVVKITGRQDGRPLMAIRRTRVKTQVVLKVVAITEKNAARTKTAGWLFAGVSPVAVEEELPDVEQDVAD